MPLTSYQARIGRLLAGNRSEDSYLAGATAFLVAPNSHRYSADLDYFHDSAARVATAHAADVATLVAAGYAVDLDISQPGYIRATIRLDGSGTKIEWAQDSTWRFMPVISSEEFGFQLHPVDAATNKVLALAGRDEPRDLIDTLFLQRDLLPLGPLVWAAVGKDPGYSPMSLLEMLRRRGRIRPEDLRRLDLAVPVEPEEVRRQWDVAIERATGFIAKHAGEETGCLFYAPASAAFVDPDAVGVTDVVRHFGRPGGVLPRLLEG